MIFDLTALANDYLQVRNVKPVSFYEEMVNREIAMQKQEEEEQLQELNKERYFVFLPPVNFPFIDACSIAGKSNSEKMRKWKL